MFDPTIPPASEPSRDLGHIDRTNDDMPGVVRQQPSSEFPQIERIRNQSLPATGLARTEEESGAASLRDRNTTHETPSLHDLDLEPLEEMAMSEVDDDSDWGDWDDEDDSEETAALSEESINKEQAQAAETFDQMRVDQQASSLAAIGFSEDTVVDGVAGQAEMDALFSVLSRLRNEDANVVCLKMEKDGRSRVVTQDQFSAQDVSDGNIIPIDDENKCCHCAPRYRDELNRFLQESGRSDYQVVLIDSSIWQEVGIRLGSTFGAQAVSIGKKSTKLNKSQKESTPVVGLNKTLNISGNDKEERLRIYLLLKEIKELEKQKKELRKEAASFRAAEAQLKAKKQKLARLELKKVHRIVAKDFSKQLRTFEQQAYRRHAG